MAPIDRPCFWSILVISLILTIPALAQRTRVPSSKDKFRPTFELNLQSPATSNAAQAGGQCTSKILDLLFIIDSSRSVRIHEFEKVKLFMIDVIDSLDISPDGTRVAVLQYASTVQNEFSFNTFFKKDDMKKAVAGIDPLSTGTMTGLAIRYAMDVAFTEKEGARPPSKKIPKVAIVVTDGRPQDRVVEVSEQARASGIVIYAVGVDQAEVSSLEAIATDPDEEHVYYVESYGVIEKLSLKFRDRFCGVKLCAVVDHGCEQICVDSQNSYHCKCYDNYTLNADKKTCSLKKLCSVVNHGCQHICVDTPGSYYCRCNEGYILNEDKKTCSRLVLDICATIEHGCEHICVSTASSYYCQCSQGYNLNGDGKTCRQEARKLVTVEDPCKCEAIVAFRTSVHTMLDAIRDTLAEITLRLEYLEARLGQP